MRCYGCNRQLSDKELLLNSDEDFINNKCLCKECLSQSNQLANEVLNEFNDTKFKPKS